MITFPAEDCIEAVESVLIEHVCHFVREIVREGFNDNTRGQVFVGTNTRCSS